MNVVDVHDRINELAKERGLTGFFLGTGLILGATQFLRRLFSHEG